VEAAEDQDRDSAVEAAEEQVAGQARAGVAARAAAGACGKQEKPRVEVEAGVPVEGEELEAPAAVEAAREQAKVREPAPVVAPVQEQVVVGELEALAAAAGEAAPVVEEAAVREPVVEEDLAVELEVAGREVVGREVVGREVVGREVVDREVVGREVVDRVEEVEDRAEEQEAADKLRSLGNG